MSIIFQQRQLSELRNRLLIISAESCGLPLVVFSLADARAQFAVNAIQDAPAIVMETMHRWNAIEVDLAIPCVIPCGVEMLSRAGYKATRFRLPINRPE